MRQKETWFLWRWRLLFQAFRYFFLTFIPVFAAINQVSVIRQFLSNKERCMARFYLFNDIFGSNDFCLFFYFIFMKPIYLMKHWIKYEYGRLFCYIFLYAYAYFISMFIVISVVCDFTKLNRKNIEIRIFFVLLY